MNVQKIIPMLYIYAYTSRSFILLQKQIKMGGLKRETRKVGHKNASINVKQSYFRQNHHGVLGHPSLSCQVQTKLKSRKLVWNKIIKTV